MRTVESDAHGTLSLTSLAFSGRQNMKRLRGGGIPLTLPASAVRKPLVLTARGRPIHRSVQHQQDFHRAGGNAIYHDIRQASHYQFACPSDVALPTGLWKIAKPKHRIPDSSPNSPRCGGIHRRDVINVTLERFRA
jgi:hypothetical protein